MAVAFNAVYFGYDVASSGYVASPFDLDEFPLIRHRDAASAMPIGAMVRIATGGPLLYAEILYKEGRHPDIGKFGDVPAWISGAPLGAAGPGQLAADDVPTRHELLVPDPHAFGEGISPSAKQLKRLRGQGRWLNEDGHLEVTAQYNPCHALHDELSEYAEYLLTTARRQLLSPLVPVSLSELAGGTAEESLRNTLKRLLEVVRSVLSVREGHRMWGSYAVARTVLSQTLQDDGPLGGDDMRDLAARLQYSAQPTAQRRQTPAAVTVYTAIGPRLRGFDGAGPMLAGLGYPSAVCHANLALADDLRGLSNNGLYENGTSVSLDDAFEGGGIWRSCFPGRPAENADPLVPAGLGWQTTTHQHQGPGHSAPPERGAHPESPAEPVDAPLDDTTLSDGRLLRITDSEVSWRMPLRLAHLLEGYLPLRAIVSDELRDLHGALAAVRLELIHPGGELEEDEAVQDTTVLGGDDAGRLSGVEWPIDFFPGLELHVQWPRGGRVMRVTTALLAVPVLVDDRVIEHCYDPGVLTREAAPGSDRRSGDSPVGLEPTRLVMRAVRRCGLLTPDGHALLDLSALPTVVYGHKPLTGQITALEAAVAELLAAGRLYPATGSRDGDGLPHYPAQPDEDAIPLIGYTPDPLPVHREAPPGGHGQNWVSGPADSHFVLGHLRSLMPGQEPSHSQRVAYREHCRRLGKADGLELPPGYTFVTEHTRRR
ncbi:hypothetical protein ACWC9S_00565 [Streptomyces xiamenensis]